MHIDLDGRCGSFLVRVADQTLEVGITNGVSETYNKAVKPFACNSARMLSTLRLLAHGFRHFGAISRSELNATYCPAFIGALRR